jgi:hypothetical protein
MGFCVNWDEMGARGYGQRIDTISEKILKLPKLESGVSANHRK